MEFGVCAVGILVEPMVEKIREVACAASRNIWNVGLRQFLMNFLADIHSKKLNIILLVDGSQAIYNLERILEITSQDKESINRDDLQQYLYQAEQSAVRARKMSEVFSMDEQLAACRMLSFIRVLKLQDDSAAGSLVEIELEFKNSFEKMLMKKYGNDILTRSLAWEKTRLQLVCKVEEYWKKYNVLLKELHESKFNFENFLRQHPSMNEDDFDRLSRSKGDDFWKGLLIVTIPSMIHTHYKANKYKITPKEISKYRNLIFVRDRTREKWWDHYIDRNHDLCPRKTSVSENPLDYRIFSSNRVYAEVMRLLKKQEELAKNLRFSHNISYYAGKI
jgi:hypothetical protein